MDALTDEQIAALDALLVVDAKHGSTPLAWLRDTSDSPSAKNFAGILERLARVRSLRLDSRIAERVHEHRFEQLVREGQPSTRVSAGASCSAPRARRPRLPT